MSKKTATPGVHLLTLVFLSAEEIGLRIHPG